MVREGYTGKYESIYYYDFCYEKFVLFYLEGWDMSQESG